MRLEERTRDAAARPLPWTFVASGWSLRERCLVMAGFLLSLSVVAVGGCSANSACDCASPQITISVPSDIASSLSDADVVLSGPACTNVPVTCANQTNGCTAYDFTANGAGECDITVHTPSGDFQQALTIVAQTGCCAGFYPTGSSTVDVPEAEDGG